MQPNCNQNCVPLHQNYLPSPFKRRKRGYEIINLLRCHSGALRYNFQFTIRIMNEVISLINEMSPYLLLGFFFAGLLHVFVPNAVYNRYLAGRSARSVFFGALLGVPLPLCSCGVIPTAMSLRKEGASKGASVAFLIATPETGVDSIAATYSLMGLPFAIVRPIVAFLTSMLAGNLVNRFDGNDDAANLNMPEENGGCCCGSHAKPQTLTEKIKEVFNYAFVEMMGDIGKWLVVGLVVAGLITVFVPDSFFEIFKGSTIMSMLLVMCIAIPMYICATGSIPIAVALIMKGLTPGAALVLLMAGPACNFASILLINKTFGKKTLFLYLLSIMAGAICAGLIIDSMPAEWFMPTLMDNAACHEEGTSWFNWACTGVLGMLLLNALANHLNGQGGCHCHEHGNNNEDKCHCHEDENETLRYENEDSCCCHEK